MATNIEQIFRSFVVNKFKEIQEENRNSENMDSSHNGELTAPGTEDASEGSSVIPQNEGSSQTVTISEDTEPKPMEIVISQNLATDKESESKDLKTTDLSSDDEVKRDSSKKKSKKHKKHKSKKKKKKKKKEKNEKRSKSTSSVEDQENASPESKSVWKPVIGSPREQDTLNTVSSQIEENVDAPLPSLGVQDHSVDSVKEPPARPQLDIESGFFGPKCPNEMHFSASSNNLTVCEVEMPEPAKELPVSLQNDENVKCTDQNNEKRHTNCETAVAIQNEISLPQPDLVLSQEKSVELEGSRLNSEGDKDLAKQSDNASSLLSQPPSKSTSASLSKSTAKSQSRSNSLAREVRSRSKSLTKVPKKQASSKSLTRQRSRSSSVVRRQRSRSSSVGQRRRSKSKSPVRRRRSQSSSPVRYSKSPIRSWWSKSIRNRQRSVSIERRRRSRTRSLVKRRRSRSRSSEKGRHSRTRSSAKRIRSRSRSANRRRKSRSTSRKHRLRSRSASRRKSKSAIRTPSKSRSPSRKRRSKSASPLRRQKSKTSSPVRRGRSRSRSAVQKRRSRSGAASRRRRSRSGSGSRRRKSRSGSAFRRRRSRSPVVSRRRRSRSPSVTRRRRSRSPSVTRRRRSRSPSVTRRRRSRSPSVTRRRRSRSPSVTRRRRSRSPSVTRRRRSRSPSVTRRRRSRSASVTRRRRSRSPSVTRRRRSRSPSVTRRRRSRSTSASRRRRSRSTSASRRRKSRSTSASRRRRSRSASRRRRSRSNSASKRDRSKFGSVSRRRKSRSVSNTRRPRSRSDSGQRKNSRSYSATKRKSRSTSVVRGEQSLLLSSASKVQSREDRMSSSSLERRSRSKGKDQKSRSRSGSIILKSKAVESEPTLQSKSSAEHRMPGTMSLDEKLLSISTSAVESVEKHNEIKLSDTSSSCNNIAIEMESNVLDHSTTTTVLDDHMKSTYSECPTEQDISSNIIECDMEIEPISFTPIETDCAGQSTEVANVAETSKEVDDTNHQRKVADLRTDDKQGQTILGSSAEDGTVCKPFDSSPGQLHGLSQLAGSEFSDERSLDPTKFSCRNKPNVEVEPESANKGSDSACKTSLKARENVADHIATSTNVILSSTEPLPNCLEISRDSESISYMKNADTNVAEIKYLTKRGSISNADHSHLTVKQDIPRLPEENQIKSLHSSLPIDHITPEGKLHVSSVTSNKELDFLYNKQGNTVTNSLISQESQNVPVLGSPSSIFPGGQKRIEEVSASMVIDNFSHQEGTPNLKSSTSDKDVIKQSCLKEKHEMQCLDGESSSKKRSKSKEEILEASHSQADLQRTELKLAAEESFSSPSKRSSSRDICISNETESRSASSSAAQSYVDNSTDKELASKDYIFRETGESEVSHPIKNKTIEVKPVKENKSSLSSMHISKDLSNACQIEESKNLPVSSPCEMIPPNTSLPLEVGKLNVHSLPKRGNDKSTSIEENSASESTPKNSPVPLTVDHHELSRSKEPTTLAESNITNFTAQASPSKSCLSAKISDSTSEKILECMSVTSANNERSFSTDSSEDKRKNQRHYEVPSDKNNAESYSECKTVSKASPLNSCAKREEDKFLYGDAAQLESSSNSISSSDRDVICLFEKTGKSRERNTSTVLQSEKPHPGTSKSSDGNLEKLIQENELSQDIVKNTVSNTEIDKERCFVDYIPRSDTVSKHSKSVSVAKDSESERLTNSTEDKILFNAVNDNYTNQEKSGKSWAGSSSSLHVQQKTKPKNEERLNVIEESANRSITEVKQLELEMQEKSTPNHSKPDPAYSGLGESKPQEDPKLSPKPFLHETGRLSVPVQFKFSKTFKTLGVSQLCSTSEDSSDVEISKGNTSSLGVTRNTTASTSDTSRSSSKTSSELPTTRKTANLSVEPSKSCSPVTEASQNVTTKPSQSDHQTQEISEKEVSQPDNLQAADDSQAGSSTKHTFPYISNAVSKLGVKQRQYRSRSVAQDSRTPSVDRGHASRSRSKSLSRRRRSHSKSSSRKKRSQSTARKKSSHSKSVRKKRSRSRSRGRKGRSQSKSKGKKKRSTSKLSGKRKRSRSKSSERIGGSKSSGKQRSSRSTSKTGKNRSKSPEKKGRSRSKSEARKNLHSKTASTRKRSRSKSPNRRRKSLSKSLSSRSRSRSVSASWKHFSQSKSSLHRKHSRSSSRSASPKRRSRSRNKRRSFSRSPAARSHSRSRSRWHRSRSRGRWRRSRSLSTSRRRSRSTSRLSSSLSSKKRKSLSPVRRRRSRSQIKQKDKSPVSKRKSTSPPPPQKKSAQPKPAGFKHSIGLKSLIQKQLSQAKSQGSTGKLSKEQIPLPNVSSRTKLSMYFNRTQTSASNLSNIGQIPVPNLAEVPLPSVSAGSQVPMPSVPPAEPLSVSSLAAETQLSVPDLTTANQWHVPDMSSGTPWSVPDIAAGTQWSMADLGTGTQWPISDLTAGSHWPMHDLTGAQWSMPDLAAGTQWAVPDVATGAQWAVPDLTAGTQWTVPDLTAGSQWAMTNMTAGAQWAVPDLASTAQWTVPDLTAGAQIQRADLAPEAQVPGSDLAPEAQVPGSDLATEAQVPGSDLVAEAQVPGSDMAAEAQVPLEHDLISEEHNVMPDVAAEALVPVASSTIVPDVAAGIPLPDVTAIAAQMPVPDVAATVLMPDVATEAQRQMSDFVSTQAYMSLSPEESVEDSRFGEPVISSEHQTESDSCDAFARQPSFDPIIEVNTLQKLETEETLSSGQQLAQDCFENSHSTEVNNQTISLDKHDLQVNQDPETDLLINQPQVEPAMDAECHPTSETCRPSDVPFASCESSNYSVQSISVESDPMQEHSLIDCHKSSEPSAISSDVFVESQSNPIPTGCVEPSDACNQPLLAVTNSMTGNNLQDKPYDSSDPMPMEQPYSKSVCPKWIAPYASPENTLQNEPSVNSDNTLEIKSHSISDLNETEACTPNHSLHEELNPSLGLPHPTERYASPEHPQLVEPYTSPDHPQLVEPYASPVHPQLVEPYPSPQHPPLVELYSSPDRPQLVEPYASPDFPQLVEPYASPDRQQLVEPYSNTEHTQTSLSPVLTENTSSIAENPEEHSISGHILTYATVTCTEINTDSSCSDGSHIKNDFSQLHEYSVTSDAPKKQDEIVDSDCPQFSKSDNASASLQEVPCPTLLKAYSLESNLSPKETTAEEFSLTERESVELSIRSHLEHSTIPAQLSTKHQCSPHTVHQEEAFSNTEQKSLSSWSSPDEQKLDASCVTTNPPKGEECATAEHSQPKEPHKDFISSEKVQEKLDNIIVPSPSILPTNEQCLNAEHAPIDDYEHRPAENQINHPDKDSYVPVSSNTIISFDQSCTITPSPDRPDQETITEHAHSEESKATPGCSFPEKLLATQVGEVLDKSPSSDPAVLQDSQDGRCSSPSKQLSDCSLPEQSFNADYSTPSEYSTKINQSLEKTIKADDSPDASVFQSQELAMDRNAENPLPSETAPLPAELPPLNQDELQCSTPNQASELSIECMKHKPEETDECIKTDNQFTTTPPDLLPYDSDQPTDMCSEPSSEPVPFNSQPPPELLPYDSEQPANSFLSISELSAEQGSSDFYAPPKLLPYDSDQPIVLHSQQKEPTGEELPVYDSTTTIHQETYRTLDLPSVDSASLNIHEIPEKCEPSNETVNPQLNFVKEVSSECAIIEFPSTEQTSSETLEEHSVPSAVDCTQEYPSSSLSSTDDHHPAQQLAEKEQPVIQPVLSSDIPEPLNSRGENQTEQTPLLTNTSEVQYSSSYELNISDSETSRVLPLMQDETSLEKELKKSPSPKSLINTECPQPQPVSRKTDPVLELKSRHEHSRSRSIERKISKSTSASQNKRSRSKSVTPTKSHSKSLVRSRRSKSRSASSESNRRSPVVKRKESTYVAHKRSSRSASAGRKRRSHSSSLSPRKRSHSPSVGRKSHKRRSPSQSRQRPSRSPSEFRRRSRSPSVTSRRRSRSSSVTRKRRSPSTSAARKKSPSPVTRRRRSPSATRRRRSPSPPATRRRRTPSPTASRRRRSPSTTRRRRSRSPSATRRRRSPSTSISRRRRSPSPSATRRRRSPSISVSRRRRSPSPPATRRRRSPSPPATRRRRSPSPSASRRRRSPSSEFRRKRSPSLSASHKRHSRSPSIPRKRRSRSTSASRRRRSRSASQRKRSHSPSVPRKRRSKSKSPSKSPTGIQSKSDRSRSLSQSEVSRKRKTRSRSSSRDKKTAEKRRKRSSSKDSSKDYYSAKQRRKSRTPPRRKKSRSPGRRASVCKSPVRRRRSRSPIRRKSFSRSPIRRKRSRSRDKSIDSARSPKRLTDLDKAQLLEIAKANAAAMCAKAGVPLPLSLKPAMTPATPVEEKITNRTYGVTIQELTEKCKQIAQSKEDDVIVNKPHDSDDEEEDRPFYNHPFKVSEHKPISFSLLNPSLKPAPKNQVTLTKEFPVSSGSQHRKKESDKVYGEWVPVPKNTEESKDDVFTNTGPAQF